MTIVREFLQWLATAPANERAEAAGTLARAYLCSDLAADELAPAEGLMLRLLDDPSPLVRRALADALAASPAAPASAIIALASDQPQIAAPIYALSPLLIDADLVDGVATGGDAVQAAIASRAVLPAAAALAELRPLIRHLCASGQLTAGLVLRALLSGNIALFEEALAELSGMPLSRVSALVHDRFGSGLRPLFEKAQLPASMHAAFKEAIKAMRDGLAEDADDARLQRRMVERVLAACESADAGDTAPLITLLRRFATEAARDEARLFCDEIATEPPRPIYSTAA